MTAEDLSSMPSSGGHEASNNNNGNDDKGSGLALFFRDFLPPLDQRQNQIVDYATSLSRVPPATQEFVREVEQSLGSSYGSGAEIIMTYREWRDMQKNILMEFLVHRMTEDRERGMRNEDGSEGDICGDNDDDFSGSTMGQEQADGEENDDDEILNMAKTQPETQPETLPFLQTQEDFVTSTGQIKRHDSPSQRPRKRHKHSKRKIVPHILDTLHEVSKLSYLDLYTQTLHLPLCQVIKVWPLRDTKRGATSRFHGIARPCPKIQHGPMPRIPFGSIEEDGPVASAYRSVFSMEVEQLPLVEAGGLASSSSYGGKNRQRIKLFFYDAYADEVSEWIDKQRQKKLLKYVLSLANIPATCIFPRAVDPHCWMDQHDMMEYCICIGDASSAKIVADGIFIRFDDDKLQIKMASMTMLEAEIDGDDSCRPDELVLSQKTCDADYFLSNSEETKENAMTASPIVSLKDAWERYSRRNQEDGGNDGARYHNGLDGQREQHQPPQPQRVASDNIPGRKPQSDHQQQHDNERIDAENQGSAPISTDSANQGRTVEGRGPAPQNLPTEAHNNTPMTFEGSACRQTNSDPIEYVKLSDLRDIIQTNKDAGRKKFLVNIYAVVLGFTSPSQTKRGDWMASAVLVDESCTTPVTIIMFCKGPTHLPKLAWMGDVLRIHRAALQEWDGGVQVLGMKFKSSYVVVRKNRQKLWQVFPSAATTYSFSPSDEERCQKLWYWGRIFGKNFPTINKRHSFTLAEMTNMSSADEEDLKDRDITVMNAGIYPYPEHPYVISPRGFLRIWDGTGFPPSDPFPVQTFITQQAASRGDPPPEALAQVVKTIQELRESNSSMEIPLSFCGRVSNMLIWEEGHWALMKEHVTAGTFLRLRNVDIRRWQNNNFRSLMVHSKTWLTPLPGQTFEVRALLEEHNNRVTRREYNPRSGLLPNNVNLGVNGLKAFLDRQDLGSYAGLVKVKLVPADMTKELLKEKLQTTEPRAPILLSVADQSESVTVIASENIREKIRSIVFGADTDSAWNELLNANRIYSAKLQSVEWDSQKYIVLKDLT